jgi:hypothetical protein
MFIVDIRNGGVRPLADGIVVAYSPTGHIVFRRQSGAAEGLWAMPVSRRLIQEGPPVPLVPGAMHASISKDGTLIYTMGMGDLQLVFRDRSGKKLAVAGTPQPGTSVLVLNLALDCSRAVVGGGTGGRILP